MTELVVILEEGALCPPQNEVAGADEPTETFIGMKVERLCPAGENRGDWGEYRGALSDKDSITEIKLIKSLLFIFTIVILNNVRNQVPFPDRNIFLV